VRCSGAAMSRRVNRPLLLVGSLPAQSTDAALRTGAELFGDLVFALPDGETGPRVRRGQLRPRGGLAAPGRAPLPAQRGPQLLSDFGVAMYCGFGRQPGQDGLETMRDHSRVVRSLG
jgi:hypothetical protein